MAVEKGKDIVVQGQCLRVWDLGPSLRVFEEFQQSSTSYPTPSGQNVIHGVILAPCQDA